MRLAVCIDATGLEWLLTEGDEYQLWLMPCRTVQLETAFGVLIVAASRFDLQRPVAVAP